MSLVENYAAERHARLVRLGRNPTNPGPTKKAEPQVQRSINAESFYPQMWFYDLVKQPKRKINTTTHQIRRALCRHFGVTPEDIDCRRRSTDLDRMRQVGFWLARAHTRASFTAIGRAFGDRDHTTVIHGAKKIARILPHDRLVSADIAHLEAML